MILRLEDLPPVGGEAVVIGSSPSVVDFNFAAFQGFRIGVGDMPWRAPEFGPYDVWVCANSKFPLPWQRRHVKAIMEADTSVIALATAAFGPLSPGRALRAVRKLKSFRGLPQLILYDQRHLEGRLCNPRAGCCAVAEDFAVGLPIQERLSQRSPQRETYSGSHSVAFHGLALAIILGATPIFVAGVDLPARRDDYRHYRAYRVAPYGNLRESLQSRIGFGPGRLGGSGQRSVFADHMTEMIEDFERLARIALDRDQHIINTSSTSLLTKCRGIQTISSGA